MAITKIKRKRHARTHRSTLFIVCVTLIAIVGMVAILISLAVSLVSSTEPETGNASTYVKIGTDTNASNQGYVQFTNGFSPGGTYSDWYFPNGNYDSLEWTFVPVVDAPTSLNTDGVLHYYAYNFSLVNSTADVGSGYAGFQTNGFFQGAQKGKVINYSIWGSNGGKAPAETLINPSNTESGGWQLMLPFNWTVDHQYAFQIKVGPDATDSKGKWWGLWVVDKTTNQTTYVGEQRVPASVNGLPSVQWKPHTSMFGEDTHWWYSLSGAKKYVCSNFQHSAMAAINITANSNTSPSRITTFTNSGKVSTDSGTGNQTVNCDVSVYQKGFSVQHNLGYWVSPAPTY